MIYKDIAVALEEKDVKTWWMSDVVGLVVVEIEDGQCMSYSCYSSIDEAKIARDLNGKMSALVDKFWCESFHKDLYDKALSYVEEQTDTFNELIDQLMN